MIDLTGQVIGKWTVVSLGEPKGKWVRWNCVCGECGKEKVVYACHLKSGMSTSCGCKRRVTHGMARTTEYNIWQFMIQRCTNEKYDRYYNYGGRGISVCERWLSAFENFYADMGPRPSKKHSLERKNNDGNYEPDNCKWATKAEQVRNMRRNIFLEYNGRRMCLKDWSKEVGISQSVLRYRMKRGWSVEQMLTTPVRTKLALHD